MRKLGGKGREENEEEEKKDEDGKEKNGEEKKRKRRMKEISWRARRAVILRMR